MDVREDNGAIRVSLRSNGVQRAHAIALQGKSERTTNIAAFSQKRAASMRQQG